MKGYSISWLRFSNSSARVTFPFGPSKTYCFSTFSQGSARRCRLRSSRNRVNSFSLARCSLRAISHSLRDTTFGRFTSEVLVDIMNLLGFGWFGETDCLAFAAEQSHHQGSQPAASRSATCDQRRRCHAYRAHKFHLKMELHQLRGLLHERDRKSVV